MNPHAPPAAFDAAAMLAQVEAWSAINTGTANLAGLAQQAAALADALARCPAQRNWSILPRSPQSRPMVVRLKSPTVSIWWCACARRPIAVFC